MSGRQSEKSPASVATGDSGSRGLLPENIERIDAPSINEGSDHAAVRAPVMLSNLYGDHASKYKNKKEEKKKSSKDGPKIERRCFRCGATGHVEVACRSPQTPEGTVARKEKNEARWKKKFHGTDSVLAEAVKDALDHAAGQTIAAETWRKENQENSKELQKVSEELRELTDKFEKLRKMVNDENEEFEEELSDMAGNFVFEWCPLRTIETVGLPYLLVFLVSLLSLSRRASRTPLLGRTLVVFVAFAAWVAHLHLILFFKTALAAVRYSWGQNCYVMRHRARVVAIPNAPVIVPDRRPDSNTLKDIVHLDQRMANVEYTDRLSGRVVRRVISLELFVNSACAMNISFDDSMDVVRARLHKNVPRSMTVALDRYDVLNSRHLVNDTIDAVVCFAHSLRDRRTLENPNF